MKEYTIYCTENQTRKALALGAPITQSQMIDIIRDEIGKHCFLQGSDAYWFPTAEQMIGWLEEQGLTCFFDIPDKLWDYELYDGNLYIGSCPNDGYGSHKEATVAAIDAALDYLTNNKK